MTARPRSSMRRRGRVGMWVSTALVVLLLAPSAASRPADISAVSIAYTIDGIVGTNGWYRGSTHGNNVILHWSITDPNFEVTSTSGCDPAITIDGPQTGTQRTCTAALSDGGSISVTTKTIKIDRD